MAPHIIIVRTIVVGPDGRVLVLRRSPHDTHKPGRIDLPGGSVEDDEEYAAAAARETLEETGLQVAEQALQLAYAFTAYKPDSHVIITRLLYVVHTAETNVRLSQEHDAYWWRTPQELQAAFAGISWGQAVDFALEYNLLQSDAAEA